MALKGASAATARSLVRSRRQRDRAEINRLLGSKEGGGEIARAGILSQLGHAQCNGDLPD